ncbi:MAG: methyltransferase domain-containing protein, partial [Gemmatimonadales bacterium]
MSTRRNRSWPGTRRPCSAGRCGTRCGRWPSRAPRQGCRQAPERQAPSAVRPSVPRSACCAFSRLHEEIRPKMLMSESELFPLLRCPRTGGQLQAVGDRLVAPSAESPVEYDVVDGRPVLVNFDHSILVREDIRGMTSVVTRRAYGGLMGLAKRIASPLKRATRANVERLMGLLLVQPGAARVLVVGGGTVGQGLESLYASSRIELAGFDIYSSGYVQFVADAHQIPLVSGSFDAVIVQAVLEHVLDPAQV